MFIFVSVFQKLSFYTKLKQLIENIVNIIKVNVTTIINNWILKMTHRYSTRLHIAKQLHSLMGPATNYFGVGLSNGIRDGQNCI